MRAATLLLLAAAALHGADSYLIRNATIHTLAGAPIVNGSVIIQDGKIAGVGKGLKAPRGAEVIDAEGRHVYPGMFNALSTIGLTEIDSFRATIDLNEKGDFNPQLRAITAVHPDGEHIPVTRANGVTHALTMMRGGVISGQASLIHLDGWTYEEMAIDADGPLVMQWPTIRVIPAGRRGSGRGGDPPPETFKKAEEKYQKEVAEIERWLEAARHYGQRGGENGEVDSRLEALVPLVEGRRAVLIFANRERTIRNAVAFSEKHGLKMILGGGDEAAKVKDLLAQKKIAVLLGPTQVPVGNENNAYDRVFAQPVELQRAGVRFAFGTLDSAYARTLPYQAGSAAAFGLSKEEALKAITLYPAQILGLGDKLGAIEEGKIANLIITTGDPLEIETRVERLFIQGREVSTDNKHRDLYEKYLQRIE